MLQTWVKIGQFWRAVFHRLSLIGELGLRPRSGQLLVAYLKQTLADGESEKYEVGSQEQPLLAP